MLHSLRFRLILVTTVLPMVTIAAAGLLIRDANAETFERGVGFSVASVGGNTKIEASDMGAAGAPDGPTISGSHVFSGGGPWSGATFGEACVAPFVVTTMSAALPSRIRPIDDTAVPIVYSASAGDQYILAAAPDFVRTFEGEREDSLASLNLKVAGVIVSAGLICGIVGFVASQRILTPVTALTGAARRLEGGDLDQRVNYGGRDEIGQLSHAFNSMAESLHRTESLRKTMTTDVAHELRTPLNNIAGFVDMLSDGLVQPDARVLATLQEETQLLVTLVDELEQLSLGDAGQLRLDLVEANVGELAERAVEAMAPRAAERGVTLEAIVEPELPGAMLDTSRIDQVFRNLLENAIRHTPEGGRMEVAVAAIGEAIELTVDDTGSGIDAEHLPFIFERFYRADASRTRHTGGSGLGLAIVRQIVEAHGGTVSAENRPEGGARLRVRLPIAGARESRSSG